MSDENTVAVNITANASGVAPAANEAKVAIVGIRSSVTDAAASMSQFGAAALATFERVTLGASSARTAVVELGESVKEARALVSEIGEAMLAAFAVEAISKFAEKMGETSEKTLHTAETFGLTVGEVQKMNAQAALFGVPAEAMATAMQRLDKAFMTAKQGSVQQANAFKQLGISLQGSYTQTELLNASLEGLSKMDAGPAKVAAAMELFGRNIQAIGPLLGLTTGQLAEANAQIDKYGAVNEVAASKGIALAESQNQGKVAMMGLNNVLTDALAPTFKALTDDINGIIARFVQSYESGGKVKIMMDALAIAAKVLVGAVDILVTAFSEMITFSGTVGANLRDLAEVIGGDLMRDVKEAATDFATLGKIIGLALTGHGAQASQLAAGLKTLGKEVAQENSRAWEAATVHMANDTKNGFGMMAKDAEAYVARMKALASDAGASAPLPKHGPGTTKDDPDAKAKKEKGAESGIQKIEDEWTDWENKHNDSLRDMQADELEFWSTIVTQAQRATLTATEQAAVKRKIETLTHTVAMQGIEEEIAGYKREADSEVSSINKALSAKKTAIAEEIRLTEDQANKGEMSRAAAYAKVKALIDQEVAAEKAAAEQIFAARVSADEAVMASSAKNTAQFKTALVDEVASYRAFQSALTAAAQSGDLQRARADQTAIDQTVKKWTDATKGIVDTWVEGTREMLQGTMSWQQFELKLWNQLLDGVVKVIEKMIMTHITGEATKTASTAVGNAQRTASNATASATAATLDFADTMKAVTNDAVKAASGAYAAMAGIPIIGPELGAAAAGATFVAVEAFGALASASGGYDIPSGINPLTQLHAQEMVLPATLANPIRSMAANYSANNGGPGSAPGGGDTHHHWQVNALDGQSVLRTLRSNSDHLQTVVGEITRKGGASRMGLAAA